jgi:cytochrome c peroxidase
MSVVTILIALVGVAVAVDLTPKEQLGKSIFFDNNLSINRNQACAACHAPVVGWTGPDEAINAHGTVYEGSIPGRFGDRKPPASGYATPSPILHFEKGLWVGGNFWDGRATGAKLGNPAADQAQGPFLNPAEQALPDSACVVYRVCTAAYPVSFEAVWGSDACDIAWPVDVEGACATEGSTVLLSAADRAKSNTNYDDIALSIAAYEASPEVNAFASTFDYARKNGMEKLSKQARKGFALFQGKGKCKNCHVSVGDWPLFTDYTYDNLGVPKNPENPVYLRDPDFIDYGLGGYLRAAGYPAAVWEPEHTFVVPKEGSNAAAAH